jgi:ATP-dependent exoDNAse (exonuclease V) beta subunit
VLRLYAAPQATDSQLHVMTIHKAKGLEFDRVILPAMARQPRSDDKTLLMWREYLAADGQSAGLIMSPLGATGDEEDPIYRYLRFEQKQSASLENARLFYVAATRAIKQLHILLTTDKDSKTDLPKAPAKNSLLNSAWSALEEQVQWSESVVENKAEQFGLDFDSSAMTTSLQRLSASWQAPAWSFPNPLQDYYLDDQRVEQGSDDLNIPVAISDPVPQCVGTVTHWVFDAIVKQGVDCWLQKNKATQQQWLQALLHYHNLPELLWPQAVVQISSAVDSTLADNKGRWLFSPQHSHSFGELALLSSIEGVVRHNAIDRCFVDGDGVLWIVDYKTSTPSENESRRDFVAREVEQYQHQLAGYKKLLAARSEPDQVIKTALYFTHYPYWCELEL